MRRKSRVRKPRDPDIDLVLPNDRAKHEAEEQLHIPSSSVDGDDDGTSSRRERTRDGDPEPLDELFR